MGSQGGTWFKVARTIRPGVSGELTLTKCVRGPELAGKKTLTIGKSTLRVCACWGAIYARRTRNEKIVHLLVLQGWKSRQRWCPLVPGQAQLLPDCAIPHTACLLQQLVLHYHDVELLQLEQERKPAKISVKTYFNKGVLCTANKKRGEEARGFTTVRGAPQNGDGRVEADFAIMRLTAQPRHKICIFLKGGAKNCSKTREMQMPADLLEESSFLPPSFGIFCRAEVKHMLDMDSDDEAALVEMCSSDSSESSDHTSDWVCSRWTVNFRSCVLCCVVHCGEVDRSTKAQARSVKVQSLTLLCQGINKTTTRSGSAVSPKKKKKKFKATKGPAQSAFEPTTIGHPGLQSQRSIPPRLYRNRRLRGEKNPWNHGHRQGVLDSRSGKSVWCAFDKTWQNPNLVCFACQITCAATDVGHCAPEPTRTPQKTQKATPSRSPA